MKKSTIKLIAMLLTVVLMLPNFAGAGALNENEVDDGLLTWEEVEEIGRLEAPALKVYRELIAVWKDENGKAIFPDWYAGSYLDDNNMLSVKIAGDIKVYSDYIKNIVSNDDVLNFEEAALGYNELCELKENVLSHPDSKSADSIFVSVEDNAVIVEGSLESLISMSKDSVYNNPNIKCIKKDFVHTDKVPVQSAINSLSTQAAGTVYPGEIIYNNAASGTLGWYGTYTFRGNSKPCILTAGHVIRGFIHGGDVKANPGTVLLSGGYLQYDYYFPYYIKYVCLDDSKSGATSRGDYGFMAYENISPSNKIYIGSGEQPRTVTDYLRNTDDLVVNQTLVYKGYGVSGFKTATVKGKNVTWIYDRANEQTITDVVSVQGDVAFGVNGDSGSPVYSWDSSGNSFTICGIFDGGTTYTSTTNTYYFTPMPLIVDAGFEPYIG